MATVLSWKLYKSDTAKQAKALFDEVVRRREYVAKVEQDRKDAERELHDSEVAVLDAIKHDAETAGEGAEGIEQTKAAHLKARDADSLNDQIQKHRLMAAQTAEHQAHSEYSHFVSDHAEELYRELQPQVEKANAALAKARADAAKVIGPLEDQVRELEDNVRNLG